MSDPTRSTVASSRDANRLPTEHPRIVICGKSRWDPPIRREHSIATSAASLGYHVDFVEQARDVRDLSLRTITQRRKPFRAASANVVISPRFSPVPGHRNAVAHWLDAAGLSSVLRRVVAAGPPPAAVVVNAPWNWSATSALPPGARRVLDIGDDWATLLPQRRERVLRDYQRIGREADAIVVVAPGLADLFDREVVVVPNAVAPELLATPPVPAPGRRQLTYVGTLSERFDCGLMSAVLELLPAWTLELYGPCHYAGRGDGPGAPLEALLSRFAGRVTWHGVVARSDMSGVLDGSDVLVLPNDPAISIGQDSMKLYDYAARARPIVATPIRLPGDGPEVLALAAEPRDFADAVRRLDGADGTRNRVWAEANGWAARLPAWLRAVTGSAS